MILQDRRWTKLLVTGLLLEMTCALSFSPSRGTQRLETPTVESPPTKRRNDYYLGNRAPLLQQPFVKLPVGSIRPEGWLRLQLLLMADGFTGRLPELSKWCQFKGSAWTSSNGQGDNGWEELPYWLRGFTDLGYVLNDNRLTGEARRWLEAILAGQRPNGSFGPETNLQFPDVWPNMLVLYALRSHFDATHDKRVLDFMARYFRWLASLPPERLLPNSWQNWRGGDNLDSIYWLYNRTGEKWLLDLARRNHEHTADWIDAIPTWHGVNLCQGFREPAQYYQQSHEAHLLNATLHNFASIMDRFGQVPGGMFGADENARPGYFGPRQGSETCSMVELMWSDELLLGITGEPAWADACEKIAFNSLPAAMTPDLKGLHYLTAPNLVQLDHTNKSPSVANDGDMFSFDPHRYRCCQHNAGFGWPYFAAHLWMATPDDGLAATLYAPSSVRAKVGRGIEIKISELTDYPFGETLSFRIETPKSVKFPLYLRIPSWCARPAIQINGQSTRLVDPVHGWVALRRRWKNGDRVELQLPMAVAVKIWEQNRNGVSIDRGPLAYSLKIGERWQRSGGSDSWPAFEVFPTSPWNYGLVLDSKDPSSSFEVVAGNRRLDAQPFTPDTAPLLLKTKAKRIPQWRQEANGLIQELQVSPIRSNEAVEEITLIPMGCARLRISAFPWIGDGSKAREWK